MLRLNFLLATVTIAMLAVPGCGPNAPNDLLRRGNGGDPETLDPSLAVDVHAFAVLGDLYEGLVVPGPDGTIQPGVAEIWTTDDEGLVYAFQLRDSARWSNGDPVTASDFVRRFRDVASPGSDSVLGSLLAPIEFYDEVRAGSMSPESLGIEAVGDRVVEIRLRQPSPQWLSILTLPIAYPMHASAAGDDVSPLAVPTNGAYRFVDWRPGEVLTLTQNPHYREAAAVAIANVEYYPIADPTAELNRYRTGELDMTHTVPPTLIDQLRAQDGDELRIAPRLALYYIAFDLGEPPFDRRSLRRALSLAVDRQAIVELLGRGEEPAYGLVPPGIPGYEPARYSWRALDDQERSRLAREALLEDGVDVSELRPVRLIYDDGDVHERIALAVAGMWKAVLQVPVELEKREWKRFLATRERRGEWDAMRFSWFGDYEDPTTFTNLFRSDSDQNLPGYRSAEYDALLDRDARAAPGALSRRGHLEAAERLLLDDYPIVPLYFYVSKHLVSQRLRGFESNALDRHLSRYLSFERSAR